MVGVELAAVVVEREGTVIVACVFDVVELAAVVALDSCACVAVELAVVVAVADVAVAVAAVAVVGFVRRGRVVVKFAPVAYAADLGQDLRCSPCSQTY